MTEGLIKNIRRAVSAGTLVPALTIDGKYLCMIVDGTNRNSFDINSKAFEVNFKILFEKKYNEDPMKIDMDEVVAFLEMECYRNKLDYELSNRIFNDIDGTIYYDLNKDDETAVQIKNGKCTLVKTDKWIFTRTGTFKNQVVPDFDVEEKDIYKFVKKHFNINTVQERKLFTLYLVSCFSGLQMNHPMLVLVGEKGSSKSTSLRKLERIVDPKTTDLCGIPKGADGLELRLSNSYLVALDNLSYLSRAQSDVFARAVTGGSITKRALYQNTEEVAINIKALLAINSVSMVAKESDILDRSLLINLKRIDSEQIKTEAQVWDDFETDLPKILGCCLKILAKALMVTDTDESVKLVRMADFHCLCLKIGKVIGISETEVSEVLWKNQSKINTETLNEDIVGLCLVELMKNRKEYRNSMTALLDALKDVAMEEGLNGNQLLPNAPNHLSRRLGKIKSNLEQNHKIFYQVVNVGTFREIRIQNLSQTSDNTDSEKRKKKSKIKRIVSTGDKT